MASLAKRLAGGEDARLAVGKVWGDGFDDLQMHWKRAQARKPHLADAPSLIKLRFKDTEDEHHDESLDVAEQRARRHVRLGDMLWTRGHKKAASLEYQRAHRYAPEDAVLASRLGRTAIEAGEPQRAVKSLQQAISRQPSYAPLRSLLGEAQLALGQQEGAREQLSEAIRLNPFDPAPHCGLSRLPNADRWEGAVCAHLSQGVRLALPARLRP